MGMGRMFQNEPDSQRPKEFGHLELKMRLFITWERHPDSGGEAQQGPAWCYRGTMQKYLPAGASSAGCWRFLTCRGYVCHVWSATSRSRASHGSLSPSHFQSLCSHTPWTWRQPKGDMDRKCSGINGIWGPSVSAHSSTPRSHRQHDSLEHQSNDELAN